MSLWEPTYGEISHVKPLRTYVDQLIDGTYYEKEQLSIRMENRK